MQFPTIATARLRATALDDLRVDAAKCIPVGVALAAAVALVEVERGSLSAGSWLPYGILILLTAAVATAAGTLERAPRVALLGPVALAGLAVWAAISASWAPIPSLARDEGLLVALTAATLATAVTTLISPLSRIVAVAMLAAASGGLALLTGAQLALADDPLSKYIDGRLAVPISYANTNAAVFLLAFWPGVVLAARRGASVAVRSLALGAAAGGVGAAMLAQSKGGVLGLIASCVVVFAVSPARVRLFVPAAIALLGTAAAFPVLTEPYRTSGAGPIRHAGLAVLVLAVVAAAVGAAYARFDNRREIGEERRRLAGRVLAALLVASIVGGAAAFLVTVDSPSGFFEKRWTTFKHLPEDETGSTHLLSLGSNRYDFWRVSIGELRRHPLEGVGARGFGPDYLIHGRSPETPARAHSVVFEVLGELGIVGFVFLVVGWGAPLLLSVRAARRRRGPAVAALGAGTAALVQASVDWTFTFPAVTIASAVALGIGAASSRTTPLSSRSTRVLTLAPVAIAVLAFAPPWLSTRFTDRALATGALSQLQTARRLDPLSTAPLLAEAQIRPIADAIPALQRAVEREPRAVANRYLLGFAYLSIGQKGLARTELREALRLKPGDPLVQSALRRAGG
jgi:hypothetical protein